MKNVLADDIPLWVVEALEVVDFEKASTHPMGPMVLEGLRTWCRAQPQKAPGRFRGHYINTTVPQQVLDPINSVDFARMSPAAQQKAEQFLRVDGVRWLPNNLRKAG